MNIYCEVPDHPRAWLHLLHAIAAANAEILAGNPRFPLLYQAPVVYRAEQGEVWRTADKVLREGFEDCDGLACWRAGELLARGHQAVYPFESGYPQARRLRPAHISARPVLLRMEAGLYHCVTVYELGGEMFVDDPSLRLGMHGPIDPDVEELRS